jgi:uncharacterized repeat protein (TIGR03803 family)
MAPVSRRLFLAVGAAGPIVAGPSPSAGAAQYRGKVLHDFCARQDCKDGANPVAGLIMDGAGNVYGATIFGGRGYGRGRHRSSGGTVFELVYDPASRGRTERILYSFCMQSGCNDGANSAADLLIDGSGNLYGTTQSGGTGHWGPSAGAGTVFELSRDPKTQKWAETVLYSFCTTDACDGGAFPTAGLAFDAAGDLYGTTGMGSPYRGDGAAFKLSYHPVAGTWTETTVRKLFAGDAGFFCRLGGEPDAGLLVNRSGELYGTAFGGGAFGGGTVFELEPPP